MVRSSATHSSLENAVVAQLKNALSRMPLLQLRRLSVSIIDGTVTLGGELNTPFEKEVALACARHIAQGREVVDATRFAGGLEGVTASRTQPALAWLERRIGAGPRPARVRRLPRVAMERASGRS